MQSIDSIETYPYETRKDLIYEKEKIKQQYNKLIQKTLMMLFS